MRSYELSISENYVPSWGVTEAVREFFQNAVDAETLNEDNAMFFTYDAPTETLRIGNKHGILDPKTLLFGYTEKNNQENTIGNHGEGYKIATVVLLRLNKQIVIYNYGHRQVWRPRFVKSRKYGVNVPTFFVDTKYVWQKVPDDDLVIEISGITAEEYEAIVASNLHLNGGAYDKVATSYGDVLKDKEYVGKIFVGGLFICEDPRIEVGVDFKPNVVRLERDRSMVNGFDVQWYLSRMIEQTKDKDLIKSAMSGYSGQYISYGYLSGGIGDELAKDFLDEYGYDAVPVSDQKDTVLALSSNTIIVSATQKKVILESRYYRDHCTAGKGAEDNSIYHRIRSFAKEIMNSLSESQLNTLMDIANDVKELEKQVTIPGETEEISETEFAAETEE